MPAPGRRRRIRSRAAIAREVVFVLAMVVVAVAAGVGLLVLAEIDSTPGPPPTLVNATVRVSFGSVPVPLASSFFGVNTVATQPLTPAGAAAVNATEARLVRWPGGNLGERFNPLADGGAGILTNDSGRVTPPAATAGEFVSWCRTIGCTAIVTLPAEIDDPATASAIVSYYERNLSFRPAYWEIGNEPARWTHFGIPWSSWNLSQEQGTTPAGFALEVQKYVTAVRAVDSATPIVGLGGVGTGAGNETSWISSVVQVNGPNLSGLAIHVYPGGAGAPGESLSTFYSSFNGSGGLAARIPADRAAIAQGCSGCRVGLFVDEFNAATGGNLSGFLSTYAVVPYISAELIEGATLGLPGMAYWDLQGSTPGAWLDQNAAPRPVYSLYTELWAHLPLGTLPVRVSAPAPGLYALALVRPATGSNATLILTDLNANVAFRLNLFATGFPSTVPYESESWDPSTPSPYTDSWSAGSSANWTIPPGGIVVWRADSGGRFTGSPAVAGYSENSATSPGSIVPNASVVKNCLMPLVAGQIGIQRRPAFQRNLSV